MAEVEYLTRGALLMCTCGTHPRRLNLGEDHGMELKNESGTHCPFINEYDCVFGEGEKENIPPFGICKADTPPNLFQRMSSKPDYMNIRRKEGDLKASVHSDNKDNVSGYLCDGLIITKTWQNVKEDSFLKNGDSHDLSGTYCSAIDPKMPTMESYLVCRRGGIIIPLTSGQEYKEK